MKIRTLDNTVMPEPTCGDCQYIYQKDLGTRRVWKCHKKQMSQDIIDNLTHQLEAKP